MSDASTGSERARHWDEAYDRVGPAGGSWFQPEPVVSLELIDLLDVDRATPVIDVGGGASQLVDRLVAGGYRDVTVLDISTAALAHARTRLDAGAPVTWICADILEWVPERRYGLWHDRAVFHFLTDEGDQDYYLAALARGLRPGAGVILGTFAEDGPQMCSGLPVARYSAEALAGVLGDRFQVLEVRREVHVTPGGGLQPFTWVAARTLS